MDTVLKLRELRARAGLTQDEVARRSRIGVKTISSFESGARIASLKLPQLESILAVYGVTLAQFFSPSLVHDLAPWETPADPAAVLTQRLAVFPPRARGALIEKITAMLDAAEAVLPNTRATSAPPPSHDLAIH
jgi:transcriptional regulator with XRE-family HTH domain